jgi:DNA polymerase-3 subunit beta
MKLICSQSELNANLSLVSRAVPSRPTHPVLANILLKADPRTHQVSLTSFDLSLGICVSFGAEVMEGGEVAIPSKLLVDIVSRLPQGNITLTHDTADNDESGMTVTLKPKSGRYQVRAMSPDEFPELPEIYGIEPINASTSALIEGIKATLFAASSDETKQVCTGVHLFLKEDTLEFAATDGHRLAVVEVTNERLDGKDELVEVTIPAKALRELQKMLSQGSTSQEPVEIYLDEGQVAFVWRQQRLTSRTLEGHYPAYNQLIPKQFERIVTIDRKQFISTLERISVLASQKNNIVKLSLSRDDQLMIVSCETQDVGSAIESIPAQVSGTDIEVGFNVKYLLEGLKELSSAEIQIHLNHQLQPVIFTPLSGSKMTYLTMPVQIRD